MLEQNKSHPERKLSRDKSPEFTARAKTVSVKRLKSLYTKTLAIDALTSLDILRMHSLFCHYYDGHSLAEFEKDLFEKDHVIVMYDHVDHSIQGFSTLMQVRVPMGARTVLGLYSGDTIVAKDYWGSKALGLAFLKYYCGMKLKNRLRPVYWFLISKGYRTYLLMANNCHRHYPRFESSTPTDMAQLMSAFYGQKFGASYNAMKNVITPQKVSCRLKAEVAPIHRELLKHPRIEFFQNSNPDWATGQELACIGELSLLTPLTFGIKRIAGGFSKRRKK